MNRTQRRARLYQQARSEEGKRRRLVLIFTGNQATDICDPQAAQKYIGAPNAKVIRCRKTGEIVEVHIRPHGDDTKRKSTGAGQSLTYEDMIADHPLVTLKIWTGDGFRRWDADDTFDGTRFNPDRLATNARELAQIERK